MKLLPGFLILSEVTACGKIPNQPINYLSSRPAAGVAQVQKPSFELDIVPEDDDDSVVTSEWYPLNDGVMGGLSKGLAEWYSLNDGVMGGLSSGKSFIYQCPSD